MWELLFIRVLDVSHHIVLFDLCALAFATFGVFFVLFSPIAPAQTTVPTIGDRIGIGRRLYHGTNFDHVTQFQSIHYDGRSHNKHRKHHYRHCLSNGNSTVLSYTRTISVGIRSCRLDRMDTLGHHETRIRLGNVCRTKSTLDPRGTRLLLSTSTTAIEH